MINKSFAQFNWPVAPQTSQHHITGTTGEYRPATNSTSEHFHSGTDIINSYNTIKEARAIEVGMYFPTRCAGFAILHYILADFSKGSCGYPPSLLTSGFSQLLIYMLFFILVI